MLGNVVGHDGDGPVGHRNAVHLDGTADHGVLAQFPRHPADVPGLEVAGLGCPLGGVLGHVLLEDLERRFDLGSVHRELTFQGGLHAFHIVGHRRLCGLVPHQGLALFLLFARFGPQESAIFPDQEGGVGVRLEIVPVHGALLDQSVAQSQGQSQVGGWSDGQPLIGEMGGASAPGVDGHNLHPPLLGLDELVGPHDPAALVAASVADVPAPGEQVARVAEVGVQDTVQPGGVLASSVSSIGAEGAVVQLGRAAGLDKSSVVEILRLASPLLPDQESGIPLPHLVHPLRHQGKGLIPRGLPPFARHPLSIGTDQRCLHPVRVVHGHNLGKALGAQGAAVARVLREPLELDHAPIDPVGQHATVLLADPAGRGHPLVGCGGRLIWRRGN